VCCRSCLTCLKALENLAADLNDPRLGILFLQIVQIQYLFRGLIDLGLHDVTELLPNI